MSRTSRSNGSTCASCFHRVILNNLDAIQAGYSVESTGHPHSSNADTPAAIDRWFLDGTALNLHLANGSVQAREYVHEDETWFFTRGRWSRKPGRIPDGNGTGAGGEFADLVAAFLAAPWNPDAKFGATQQDVVNEFYNYMWTYGVWGSGTPPFDSRLAAVNSRCPPTRP